MFEISTTALKRLRLYLICSSSLREVGFVGGWETAAPWVFPHLTDRLAEQVIDLRAGDAHVDEFADGGGAGEEDAAVDVGGVGAGAGDFRGVHEGADGAADLRGADFAGDALLEFHRALVAGLFHFHRELAVEFRGARTFLLAVGEDAEALETRALDEVEEGLEFLLGLAGEADDEGGADGDAGDACSHAGLMRVADVSALLVSRLHQIKHVIGWMCCNGIST